MAYYWVEKQVPFIRWKNTQYELDLFVRIQLGNQNLIYERKWGFQSEKIVPKVLEWLKEHKGKDDVTQRWRVYYLSWIPGAQIHRWCFLRCLLPLSSSFSASITETINPADWGLQSPVITTNVHVRARGRMVPPSYQTSYLCRRTPIGRARETLNCKRLYKM